MQGFSLHLSSDMTPAMINLRILDIRVQLHCVDLDIAI